MIPPLGYRTQAGLTQRELAAKLGVSRTLVAGWESGRRHPSERQLAAITGDPSVPPVGADPTIELWLHEIEIRDRDKQIAKLTAQLAERDPCARMRHSFERVAEALEVFDEAGRPHARLIGAVADRLHGTNGAPPVLHQSTIHIDDGTREQRRVAVRTFTEEGRALIERWVERYMTPGQLVVMAVDGNRTYRAVCKPARSKSSSG